MPDKKKTYFKIMSIIHETMYGWMRNPINILYNAGLKEGQSVLEAGCGPGFFTLPAGRIIRDKGDLLSIDINPIAVEHVNRKVQVSCANNIQVKQVGAAELEMPENSFDFIFVFGMAHPIGGMDKIWRNLHRMLKDDGILSVEGRLQPPADLFRQTKRKIRIFQYHKANFSELAPISKYSRTECSTRTVKPVLG